VPKPLGTGISARLHRTFFNTGTPTAGGNLGNVIANIGIHQQGSASELQVFGRTFACADAECITSGAT
jgi:hypothetical protein